MDYQNNFDPIIIRIDLIFIRWDRGLSVLRMCRLLRIAWPIFYQVRNSTAHNNLKVANII